MKKILFFIFLFAPVVFYGHTTIEEGPVSGQWTLSGSPYFVVGDVYVPESSGLIIDAGVEVYFYGWYKLEVFGSLTAMGNSSSMILFSIADGYENWHGIRFMETTATSHLDHCIIEHAAAELEIHSLPESYGGGILCYNSPNANITITNSTISNNTAWYGGGVLVYRANLHLENCLIKNNDAVMGAGVCVINNSITEIRKNTIMLNQASKGGGVLYQNSRYDDLECNYIVNNMAEYGAGIYMTNAGARLCNNTIARNVASENGGGIYFYNNSSPDIYSSNIYYNEDGVKAGGQQIYLANGSNDPSFYYCNVLRGMEGFSGAGSGTQYSGTYENCVDSDPLFKNMYNGNYSITWTNYPYDDQTKSICIDNGCPDQDPDPDKSCCDIGACSYFQILDIPVNVYGNSISSHAFISDWDPSFGALGYEFDVAYDRYFEDMIYENQKINTNKVYVYLPEVADMVWLRVRSFNTGITSENSNSYAFVWVSLSEEQAETPKIFASTGAINISTPQAETCNGQAWIYNTSGQLLGQYSLASGTNTISMGYTKQIVIVKVVMNNQVYQQKLLLH